MCLFDCDLLAKPIAKDLRSYLQFIPSLYVRLSRCGIYDDCSLTISKLQGSSPCLTAATNCLLSKVKGILSPYDQCKEVTMRLYAKALRSLQDAISSETGCMDAEILCATRELSFVP
jgi:hypothetical protein